MAKIAIINRYIYIYILYTGMFDDHLVHAYLAQVRGNEHCLSPIEPDSHS